METFWPKKLSFLQLKRFVDKTTFHFHSFDKINNFVTTQYATAIFYPFQLTYTAEKMNFSINDFFSKCDQIQETADLFTFTEEILNGKLDFLCSANENGMNKAQSSW